MVEAVGSCPSSVRNSEGDGASALKSSVVVFGSTAGFTETAKGGKTENGSADASGSASTVVHPLMQSYDQHPRTPKGGFPNNQMYFITHALSDWNKTSITHLPLSTTISLDHHKMERALREVAKVVVVAEEETDAVDSASQVHEVEQLGVEVAKQPLVEVTRRTTEKLRDSTEAGNRPGGHHDQDGVEVTDAMLSVLFQAGSGESPSSEPLEAVYESQEL